MMHTGSRRGTHTHTRTHRPILVCNCSLSHWSPGASSVQARVLVDSTLVAMSRSRPRSTPVEVYEGFCEHCHLPLRVTISVVTEGPNAGKRVCNVAGVHGPRGRSRSRPRAPSPRLELVVEDALGAVASGDPPGASPRPTVIEEDSLPTVGRVGDVHEGESPRGPPVEAHASGPALQDMPLLELAEQW